MFSVADAFVMVLEMLSWHSLSHLAPHEHSFMFTSWGMVKHKQEVKKYLLTGVTDWAKMELKHLARKFYKLYCSTWGFQTCQFQKACLHLLDITQDSSVISRTSKKGHMRHSLSITTVFMMSQIANTVLNLSTTASLGQNQCGREVGVEGRFQQE